MKTNAAQRLTCRIQGVSTAPSIITCETCTPLGPSSRAILCESARNPDFATEKAAKLAPPRVDAVAPVKIMLPRSLGVMYLAASLPTKNPE